MRRRLFLLPGIFFTCCLLFVIFPSFAQTTVKTFLRKFTQQDGLSSFFVRQALQDKYGFVYIATQEGLDRFDGRDFFHYRKTNEQGYRLAGIDIRSIVEDTARNLLWVLPGENGINAISTNTGKVTHYIPMARDNENEWNLTLFLDEGKLFVGTSVGVKVFDINNDRFLNKLTLYPSTVSREEGYPVRSINKDPFGNLWVCYSGYGIVVYDRKQAPLAFIPNSRLKGDPGRMNALVFIDRETALLATNAGLLKIKFSSSYQVNINPSPCANNEDANTLAVQHICLTSDGGVYVAGSKHLYRFDHSLSRYSVIEDVIYNNGNTWLTNVLSVFEDRDRSLWIGCNQGLAFYRNRNTPFSVIYQSESTGERLEHVTSVFKSSHHELFMGTYNGLAVSNYPYTSFFVLDKAFMFQHVYEDRSGLVHVSRNDRMFIYRDKLLRPVEQFYPEFEPFSHTPINTHVFLNDSLVLLGTENYTGILVWNEKTHTVRRIDERSGAVRLGSGIVNGIYKDSKSQIWVLSDNVITILPGSLSSAKVLSLHDDKSDLPAGLFFDMCEMDGKYWIASYGTGIIEMNNNFKTTKIFSRQDGLSNDGIYRMFPYENKLLITTNYGLSVLDIRKRSFRNYYRGDGLHSDNFEEFVGYYDKDTIYTGGIRGVSVIEPVLLYRNEIPPLLYINRIELESADGKKDSFNLFFKTVEVPENTTQTTVFFSGINFTDPDRTVFAYRIKEQGPEWINLNTQNSIPLIGLGPGTYHLQVRAANEDGVWSEPKELVLEFLPKWYQTWWFKLLIVLATAGIIYAFYRYRIRQIEKQHEIRKNIATDLHDDLGSTLNSVKVFTNLAIRGVNQEESLQQIKDNLSEATLGLRDMIWVLDDSLDTVEELVTRLKQFAIPVAAASNIEAIITASSDVSKLRLSKEEKRNLFLVCKEALNNSIKYAEATHIYVSFTPNGKKIKVSIADNGKGFDTEQVKKGYGLKNMQYRAGQVKYAITVSSTPGQGTTIEISPA